jgi:hypothetical protein
VYHAISNYLNENQSNFSTILFRYPTASLPLHFLTKKHKKRIVFEHNTKEIEEMNLHADNFKKSLPFKFKLGYFIYLFERGYLAVWLEKVLGKHIFKNAKLGIAVTNEIADYEKKRCSSYIVNVVSNGIDVEQCALRNNTIFDGTQLKLFMLIGSPNSWHGIDRIVKSMEAFTGSCNITLDIIGNVSDDDKEFISNSPIHSKINLIASMAKAELDEKLNGYHMGVGSLAMHRINLKEACPLKTREYLARGFAVMVGYKDTDFLDNSFFDGYYYNVVSNETNINFEEVIVFISNLFKDDNHPQKIRAIAKRHLDTNIKMQKLVETLAI